MNFLAESLKGLMDLHMNTGVGEENGEREKAFIFPVIEGRILLFPFEFLCLSFPGSHHLRGLGCMCISLWRVSGKSMPASS